MSVRPLNKRFALIVALYNCRKRDYNTPIKSSYKSQNFTYTLNLTLPCENTIKIEKKIEFLDLL